MEETIFRGAEAIVSIDELGGLKVIKKVRISKGYRIEQLDRELTLTRSRSEKNCLKKCSENNCCTPKVLQVNVDERTIWMEYISESISILKHLSENPMDLEISSVIGKRVSEVHLAGVIHGDLTTTNIVCKISDPREIYIIDFGLSFMSKTPEDRAVDLYVLVRSITSSVPFTDYEAERFNAQIIRTYSNNIGNKIEADKIISRFEQVKLRGRKRLAIG